MPLTGKFREIAKENHELELTYGFKAKMLYPVGSPEFDSSEKMVLIEKSHADRLAEALVKACGTVDSLEKDLRSLVDYPFTVDDKTGRLVKQHCLDALARAKEILGGGE